MAEAVIIGTGIAGISALKALSERRPGWEIVLIGEEDRLPYKRTKISKSIAQGFSRDEYALLDPDWYRERNIDIRLGRRALAIHPETQTVDLDDGNQVSWNQLILAPGARARTLAVSGPSPEYCHTVRQAGDVENLITALDSARSVIVIGLGVLGVEIAEQLCIAGLDVTAVSGMESVMPRELNAATQDLMDQLFRGAGVTLKLGYRVTSITSSAGSGGIVVRTSEEDLVADRLVFAVGSDPDVRLAADAGIEVSEGILVDRNLETSIAGIYAAGDAVQMRGGSITHLWHEAEAQGHYAAINLIGPPARYPGEVFRLKCQVFGHYFFSMGRPDPAEMKLYRIVEDTGSEYRCFYFKEDRLSGMVMADDAERSKEYEHAVRAGLSEAQVRERFLS